MKYLREDHNDLDSCFTWVRSSITALILVCAGTAGAQTLPPSCGGLNRPWGPFDYRADRYVPESTYGSHSALLNIVERAHFTPEVEMLIRGKSSGARPGGDLSYTLNVFPNHHRALIAVSKLAVRDKSPQPTETQYTVECYFQRAMVFRPDDMMVRMIYANYLIQINRARDAEAQLEVVASKNSENALTQRNLSLLFFEARNYDKSLVHAHKASALGLNIDVLKERLQQVGKWQAPPTQIPADAADAASAPSSAASRKE